jgi:hypothetical protein
MSAFAAGAVVCVMARGIRVRAGLGAALGAAAGAVCWNAILVATHATSFFTDAPIRLLPASWQDTGSGVFTIAATTLVNGLVLVRDRPAKQAASWALAAGLVAFAVDVYLY